MKIMCSEPKALLASLARNASWDLTPASVLNTQQAHLTLCMPVHNVNERCLERWLRFKTIVCAYEVSGSHGNTMFELW